MPVQIQGGNTGSLYRDTVLDADGESFEGLLVLDSPMEAAGQYRIAHTTGELSAGLPTGAVLFSARWSNPTGFASVEALEAVFQPLALMTGTLTDATSFAAYIARNFSTSHAGGSGSVLTGNKMRAGMPNSQFADIRIAGTTMLTGAVFTPDPHAFAMSLRKDARAAIPTGTVAEETIQPWPDDINLLFRPGASAHPLVLAQNEGVLVVNRTAWPAGGGTGKLMVRMVWSEGAAY